MWPLSLGQETQDWQDSLYVKLTRTHHENSSLIIVRVNNSFSSKHLGKYNIGPLNLKFEFGP